MAREIEPKRYKQGNSDVLQRSATPQEFVDAIKTFEGNPPKTLIVFQPKSEGEDKQQVREIAERIIWDGKKSQFRQEEPLDQRVDLNRPDEKKRHDIAMIDQLTQASIPTEIRVFVEEETDPYGPTVHKGFEHFRDILLPKLTERGYEPAYGVVYLGPERTGEELEYHRGDLLLRTGPTTHPDKKARLEQLLEQKQKPTQK